jgi:hypothetical protein
MKKQKPRVFTKKLKKGEAFDIAPLVQKAGGGLGGLGATALAAGDSAIKVVGPVPDSQMAEVMKKHPDANVFITEDDTSDTLGPKQVMVLFEGALRTPSLTQQADKIWMIWDRATEAAKMALRSDHRFWEARKRNHHIVLLDN